VLLLIMQNKIEILRRDSERVEREREGNSKDAAAAIALVLVGLNNRTSRCLFFRHSYMLYHRPDDSLYFGTFSNQDGRRIEILLKLLSNLELFSTFPSSSRTAICRDSSCEHPFPQTYFHMCFCQL
jgi:hypothetical protein